MIQNPSVSIKHISILIFSVLGLYSYYLVNNSGFFWDDIWMVQNNPYIKSMSYDNIFDILTTSYKAQYSPINTFLYCIIYKLSGLDSFTFHLINVLIHIINTLLVYVFIVELLSFKYKSYIIHNEYRPLVFNIAFLTALFFGIAPMQVESVAWISASKILLYSFFFLLASITYVQFLKTKRIIYIIYTLILFILSFGSKEQAVEFPFIMIIIYFFINKTVSIKAFLSLVPFLILALFFGIFTIKVQNSGFQDVLDNNYYSFWQRVVLACFSLIQYVLKCVIPTELDHNYQFPMLPGEPLPLLYFFYPITILIFIYYLYKLYKLKKEDILFFGIGFFVINLLLVLHLIPMVRSTVMADRYVYLPIIGLFLILSYYFNSFLQARKQRLFQLRLPTLALSCYIIFIYIVTATYLSIWNIN